MKKVTSRKVILAGAVLFLGMPAIAAASSGMIGDCVDCHTMHNSEQGEPVAMVHTSTSPSATPIQNLLRMDCISCHANNPTGGNKIIDMGGGSQVPQVMHKDATGDLAGGNFDYINLSPRKGHNLTELGLTEDTNGEAGLTVPPGMWHGTSTHATAARFTMDGGFLANFTCAGSAGCHGVRNQAFSADLNTNVVGTVDGPDYYENVVRRQGLAAISGAHHNNYDGLKNTVDMTAASAYDGQAVADGYRFIPGLLGLGNELARWQNVDGTNHNEYYGNGSAGPITGCSTCHQNGNQSVASHVYTDGYMKVPNNDVAGFCMTCHGEFHSTGNADDLDGGSNGSSGAFLRHPTDYALPTTGEYTGYTDYTITAPVARPDLTAIADASLVATGDRVMCLSCHMAHASQYDGMLRFNYERMQAGNADAADLGTGCLACHTTKGVFKN